MVAWRTLILLIINPRDERFAYGTNWLEEEPIAAIFDDEARQFLSDLFLPLGGFWICCFRCAGVFSVPIVAHRRWLRSRHHTAEDRGALYE